MSTIRSIPDKFGANGYQYTLLRRSQKIAMYVGVNSFGDHIGYEVHRIRVDAKGRNSSGTRSDGTPYHIITVPREKLAGNEEFGAWAWATWDLDHANRIFETLDAGAKHPSRPISI